MSGKWGLIFPPETAGLIFTESLIWAGAVKDGQLPELRAGGGYYIPGTVPGRIAPGNQKAGADDPSLRIWRIRRDWETADLTPEVASLLGIPPQQVTQDQINMLREEYRQNWENWPSHIGAPFEDLNSNGIRDPGEKPGLADADQVLWFVYSDLDSSRANNLFGSPPIGLEIQVTIWAYNPPDDGSDLNKALRQTIFKRYRIIYKGTKGTPDTARIENMYLGQFVDPDVGYYADDFLGCDTLLQMGYAYNATTADTVYQRFGLAPPAIGYTLLQGPLVASDSQEDFGYFDFRAIRNRRNLPMTSFWAKRTGSAMGDPQLHSYEGTLQISNILRSLYPMNGMPIEDPEGNPTHFMLAGDPLTQYGWIDGIELPPGDRRFLLCTGPFTLAVGDTQEIILAIVAGSGSDHLASLAVLKHFVRYIRSYFFSQLITNVPPLDEPQHPKDFILRAPVPNPFLERTNLRVHLRKPAFVRLTVYNVLGQTVRELVARYLPAGTTHILWDGRDRFGVRLPSGCYFVRLESDYETIQVQKILLLR
jgi:hypothetical protein